MGRLFLTEFDQADGIYLCVHCDTHIALKQNRGVNFNENELVGYIFTGVRNVNTNPAQDRIINNHTVTEIYCTKCGYDLGFKIIQAAPAEVAVNGGDCVIPLGKLKIVELPDD